MEKLELIRTDDPYGGYRVAITAFYDTIRTPFTEQISDMENTISIIAENKELEHYWQKYQAQFYYASDISFKAVVEALTMLCTQD